ncbi:MAG: hypothetical protein QOJ70_1486 [Acidobacteriota bacterium]|jgi:hypothetical protein|nr:hypothetical protein [Acidobacteriota bacterium]
MIKRCPDEGILQAYIDGELSREQTAATAAHLAACEACATALASAESQIAFFSTAFAPDDSLSVPTEVLRARINASVAQLETSSETNHARRHGRSFDSLFASLRGLFTFTPQSAAAFASVLALIAIGIIYFSAQRSQQVTNKPENAREIARVNPAPEHSPEVKTTPKTVAPIPTSTPEQGRTGTTAVKINYTVRHAANSNGGARRTNAPAALKEEALPGERDYQTAIASLEKTIKMGGDASLRPSLRVEYERNIALLDTAISQTRSVAARNPKDKDAVSFLIAAYQSKVELLTKVADQAQVAALGR